MAKNQLLVSIETESRINVGRYNLIKNQDEKSKKLEHHRICKRLMEISQSKNIPMTTLVYIGIGRSAHKPQVFQKGYTNLDEKMIDKVLSFADVFSKKFNGKYRTNDLVLHFIHRYVSHDGGLLKFKQLMDRFVKNNPKFKLTTVKTAKELTQMICGDDAEYSESGYITSVSKPSRFTNK